MFAFFQYSASQQAYNAHCGTFFSLRHSAARASAVVSPDASMSQNSRTSHRT
jgi:hypothetical protein